MLSTTIIVIPKHFQEAMIFENYFFIVKNTVVQPPLLARLATVLVLLEAGGKPSTWFPPERLVELTWHLKLPGFIIKRIHGTEMFIEKIENLENLTISVNLSGTGDFTFNNEMNRR